MTEVENRNNGGRKFYKRPDDTKLKSAVEKLRVEIKQLDLASTELTNQINKYQLDQKVLQKRNDLQAELKELISKQRNFKQDRDTINEQIKAIDSSMKKKIQEVQLQTSKNQFKTVGEIDQRIAYLDNLIDQGNLKLVDERKYIKEMSSLRKLKKDFTSIEKIQLSIDQDKIKISQLKASINSHQSKEVQKQFESIQNQLDEINKSNKSIIDKKNEIFNKRQSIRKQKDEKYQAIRDLNADFDQEMTKFKKLLSEERARREQEEKQSKELQKQQERKKFAQEKLDQASIPAFSEEIESIHNLLAHFDPTYVKPTKKMIPSADPSITTVHQERKIEMPADFVVISKKQEEFVPGSSSKSKKNKKSKSKTYTADPAIIVALTDLSIDFPKSEADIENTITILKETLQALQDKQEEQTKINIENAKKLIAKLEQEQDAEENNENIEPESEQST